MRKYMHANTHIRFGIRTCMHAKHTHMCMCVYIYIYTHAHINTHTHICTFFVHMHVMSLCVANS